MELLRQLINFWILATIACWLTLLLFYRYFDSGDFRAKLPQISRLNLNNSYIKIALVIIAAIILFFGIATELHKTIGGSGQFFQNGDEIASFVDVVIGAPVTLITSALALVLAYSALISSRQQNEISLALSTLETVKVPMEQIINDFEQLPPAINQEIHHAESEVRKLMEQSPLRYNTPFDVLNEDLGLTPDHTNLSNLNDFCATEKTSHPLSEAFISVKENEVLPFNNQWNSFIESKLVKLEANITPQERIIIRKFIHEIDKLLPPEVSAREWGYGIYADSLYHLPHQDCFHSLRAIITFMHSISILSRIGGNRSEISVSEALASGHGYFTDFFKTLSEKGSLELNLPTDRVHLFNSNDDYYHLVRISGLDEFIYLLSFLKRPALSKVIRTLDAYNTVKSGLMSIVEAGSVSKRDDNSLSDQVRNQTGGMISIAQLYLDDLTRSYNEFASSLDKHFAGQFENLEIKICKTTIEGKLMPTKDPRTGDEDWIKVPNFLVDDIEWEEEVLIDFSDLVRLKRISINT